jgi:hypothetical protein
LGYTFLRMTRKLFEEDAILLDAMADYWRQHTNPQSIAAIKIGACEAGAQAIRVLLEQQRTQARLDWRDEAGL